MRDEIFSILLKPNKSRAIKKKINSKLVLFDICHNYSICVKLVNLSNGATDCCMKRRTKMNLSYDDKLNLQKQNNIIVHLLVCDGEHHCLAGELHQGGGDIYGRRRPIMNAKSKWIKSDLRDVDQNCHDFMMRTWMVWRSWMTSRCLTSPWCKSSPCRSTSPWRR